MTRQLLDRIETYSEIIPGHCSSCGKKYDKIIDSSCTNRTNGIRYAKEKTTAWGAFRCYDCKSLIEDTWTPDIEAAP